MNLLQTSGLKWRHETPPVMDCLAIDAQHARHSGSIAIVELKDINAEHEHQSTVVDKKVKCSGLPTIYSAPQKSPLGYAPMGNPRRVVRRKPFNGWVIRELRKDRDLSQEQLAALAGMKKANISKIERARSQVAMSYENFLDLARALYVAPEELRRRLSEAPPSGSPAPSSRTAQRA